MTTNVDIRSAGHVPIAPGGAVADERGERIGSLRWRLAPVLVAGAIAVAYLILEPRTVDLAASVFRARLFGDAGFTIWNNTWYAGHPTWSYSVLVPPLTWLLSPALVGALSTVASAALFEPLARHHFGACASRWGALWFGAGAATPMLSGRITFAAGVAAALGALLAVQRGRPWLGCVLALATGLMSPVAGLFLAIAFAAYGLAGTRRAWGVALAAAAIVPPAVLGFVFREGHGEPFVLSAFWPVPLFALAFYAALPARERTLRAAALLYALGAVGAYAIVSPVGGNMVRFGALAGGPVLLCALLAARRRVALPLAALLVAFGVWQWSAAVRDIANASGDPSTDASFYRPLKAFLAGAGGGPFRVEIPFTFSHWEAAEVSPRFHIARGWQRQLDIQDNHLFYGGRLDANTYRSWLAEHGVRFVAVARAKPDYSARAELRLIASRPPYLRPVWSSRDWQVFEVAVPHPLALGAQVVRLGVSDVVLRFDRPGTAVVRVRWSPYWRAGGACVERAGQWTRVIARRPGRLRMAIDFSPERIFAHGRRCGSAGGLRVVLPRR